MSKTLSLRPRLSEKTYGLAGKRVYVVEVPEGTNKHTVVRAIEAQFEVKVVKVNILNVAGKAKRVYSITGKRTRNATGRRKDIRKAYVTLAEGQSLPFFAAVEEAEEKEQASQAEFDKAVSKQAEKETKPTRRGLRRKKASEENE
jgi:large subunit ribosomal protein L23